MTHLIQIIAVSIFLSSAITVLAQVNSTTPEEGQCLSQCMNQQPSNFFANCCGCCEPDEGCNGNRIQQFCCKTQHQFCGCISSRAFCSGRIFNSSTQPSSPFGTCYDPADPKTGGQCCYLPAPNYWIVCPAGTTCCSGFSSFEPLTCCQANEVCSVDTMTGQPQCIQNTTQPTQSSQPTESTEPTESSEPTQSSQPTLPPQPTGDSTSPRLLRLTVPDRVDLVSLQYVHATLEVEDDMSVRYVNFGISFPVGNGASGRTVGATLKSAAEAGVPADKHGIWEANLTLTGFGNTPIGNGAIQVFIGDFSGNDVSYDPAALTAIGLPTHVLVFDSSRDPPTADNCAGRKCIANDECCKDEVLGAVCYSPNTHRCVASRRLCGKADSVCGTACFNPKTHTCFGSQLCARGFQICRNMDEYACYNPDLYICENGMLKQKPARIQCGTQTCSGNQACCANKTCYDPTRETCCSVLATANNPGTCSVNWDTGAAMQCCSAFAGSPVSCYDPLDKFCCITSSPGGSSSRLCDAKQTTFECCGDRGFRVPV